MNKLASNNCPKCGAEMKAIALHDLVVECCLNCHGSFLAYSQLKDPMIHRFSETWASRRKDAAELDGLTIPCPKCGVEMKKRRLVSKLGLLLDTCPHCKGVWFDQDELTKYRKPWKVLFRTPKKMVVSLYCLRCNLETKFDHEKRDPFQCPICGDCLSFLAKGEVFETIPFVDTKKQLASVILSLPLLCVIFFGAAMAFHNIKHAVLFTGTIGLGATIMLVRLVVYNKFAWSTAGTGPSPYGLVQDFDISSD